ncbi:MAG: hypothetical protein PHF00_00155 [Elusimicrobia bacterium]|nr:hypothetical protein [Elusimicrobiota bacterium]
MRERGQAAAGISKLVAQLKSREAALCAALIQAAGEPAWTEIGRVEARTALAGRLTLADGRSLDVLALQESSGLLSHARVELEGKVLDAKSLEPLLRRR